MKAMSISGLVKRAWIPLLLAVVLSTRRWRASICCVETRPELTTASFLRTFRAIVHVKRNGRSAFAVWIGWDVSVNTRPANQGYPCVFPTSSGPLRLLPAAKIACFRAGRYRADTDGVNAAELS